MYNTDKTLKRKNEQFQKTLKRKNEQFQRVGMLLINCVPYLVLYIIH